MGLILFFISVLGFSFSNVYWKKTILSNDIPALIFSRGLITTFCFGLIALLDFNTTIFKGFLGSTPQITTVHIIYTILLSAFSYFGLYFFLKSTKNGSVNLTNTISSINIFGILTAVFILKENWLPIYWAIFFLIICAIIILNITSIKNEKTFHIKYGILASFFWGIAYTLFSFPIKWIGVSLFTFLLEATITTISGLVIINHGFNYKNIPWKNVSVLAICIVLGSIFLHVSYNYLSITKIIIYQKITPVMSLILGQMLYKEKLKWHQWFAIFLIILGISLTVIKTS